MMNNKANEKTTSKDVALLAGVSQSTVSRAFSVNSRIAPGTLQRVMNAADLLSYQPNAFARGLVLSRSNFISVVKGYNLNPAFSEILSALSHMFQQCDKQIIYFEAKKDQSIDDMMKKVLQYQVEGVVLLYTNLSSNLTLSCQKLNIPVLQIYRHSTSVKTNAVLLDNFAAAQDAATLFVEKGYENFVYLGGDVDASTNMERQMGFCKKLKEYDVAEPLRIQGDFTYESGRQVMRDIARKISFPAAVLCANDMMALGAIDTLKFELNLNVGTDVAVVGFDDVYMSAWPAYSLTTFQPPIEDMARNAVDLMLENIRHKGMAPQERRYRMKLIERDSTVGLKKSVNICDGIK